MPATSGEILLIAAEIAGKIRCDAPRIHCLTNTVAEPLTANALLAIGAVPSMTSHGPELSEFVSGAQGLLVNLGTPTATSAECRQLAAGIASDLNTPWVLDPVMVDRSNARRDEAVNLLALRPTMVRGNQEEMNALDGPLADFSGVTATTGEADRIVQRDTVAHVHGGSPMLTQVTATGCALSAVIAAFSACHTNAFEACAAACASYAAAGAEAASKAGGPGSFSVALLDALSTISLPMLNTWMGGKISGQGDLI